MYLRQTEQVEEIRDRIEADANMFLNIEGKKMLFPILGAIVNLIRDTDIPDEHIVDINAIIGIYLDDCQYRPNVNYQEVFETIQKYIDDIQNVCKKKKLIVSYINIQKLKDYRGDDSIFSN